MVQAFIFLDFGFLIDVLMNNLFWVFAFIAAGYFFSDKKSFILFGAIFSLVILFSFDIFIFLGFGIYTGVGLMFLYLARMAVLLFLENTKGGQDLIPLMYVLVFYFTLAVVALGLL